MSNSEIDGEWTPAKAWRDGRFWLVEMVIADQLRMTQARSLSEAQAMADDLLEIFAGGGRAKLEVVPPNEELVAQYRGASARAEEAQAALSRVARETVRALRSDGLSVRDVAQVMGISPGRVSQLAS